MSKAVVNQDRGVDNGMRSSEEKRSQASSEIDRPEDSFTEGRTLRGFKGDGKRER